MTRLEIEANFVPEPGMVGRKEQFDERRLHGVSHPYVWRIPFQLFP